MIQMRGSLIYCAQLPLGSMEVPSNPLSPQLDEYLALIHELFDQSPTGQACLSPLSSLEPRSSGQPPGIFCHQQTDLKGLKWISICMFNIGFYRMFWLFWKFPTPASPLPSGWPAFQSCQFLFDSPTRILFFKSSRSQIVDSLLNSHYLPSKGHSSFSISWQFSEMYWMSQVVLAKDMGFWKHKGFEVPSPQKNK